MRGGGEGGGRRNRYIYLKKKNGDFIIKILLTYFWETSLLSSWLITFFNLYFKVVLNNNYIIYILIL